MQQFQKVRIDGLHESKEGWYLGVGKDGCLLVVNERGTVLDLHHHRVEFILGVPQTPPIAMGAIHADTTAEPKKTACAVCRDAGCDQCPDWADDVKEKPKQPGPVKYPDEVERLAAVAHGVFTIHAYNDPWRKIVLAVLKHYLSEPLKTADFEAACAAYLSACNDQAHASAEGPAMRAALKQVFANRARELEPTPPTMLDDEAREFKYEDRE